MKCQYCGNNLGLRDERCPHCGEINVKAQKHIATIKGYKDDYEKTKETSAKKSINTSRLGRVVVIAIMIIAILVMKRITLQYSDIDTRIKNSSEQKDKNVVKHKDEFDEKLKELEKNREYLALNCFVLENGLRSNNGYVEYSRVFSGAISYSTIHDDILSIVTGYTYFGKKTKKDWCDELALSISQWNKYVGGEFWHDSNDSPMHTGEHGAFLSDIKKDAQDMVQAYFGLSDEQAGAMWTMGQDELAELLYEKCEDYYPEVSTNE